MKRLALTSMVTVAICGVLQFACNRSSPSALQFQSREDKNMTPLMIACKNSNHASVSKLLAAGADVNIHTEAGYTALHAAAIERNAQIIQALISAGADVNSRTKNNITPLICSVGSPYSDPKIALALIRAGADVNVADVEGETALWIATTDSSLEVMEELLKDGANPNVQPQSLAFRGNTPLHMAALNGLTAQVELLLHYGANPTLRNANRQRPVDVVNENFPQIREILNKHSSGG